MGEPITANPSIADTNSDNDTNACPFEGPEKLLEIWFEENPQSPYPKDARTGLRTVDRLVWEEMLDIVKCKVLSVVMGREMDAYLLSESSFFVFPHKLILKTCGTTLNLLGLPRILAIARERCGYNKVWRCFYSRKSFMFPERQVGPHREWRNEVEYLDALFDNGAAYTVGKVNGDHWLLYITSLAEPEVIGADQMPSSSDDENEGSADDSHHLAASMALSVASSDTMPTTFANQDYTIELLMTRLSAPARRPFFFHEEDLKLASVDAGGEEMSVADASCASKGNLVSRQLGIDSIFPASRTRIDSYAFEPCGYSANALIDGGDEHGGEGYYTIHVTPEEGWSYASFECNVPVNPAPQNDAYHSSGEQLTDTVDTKNRREMPDLETLIQRVVNIFQPGHLSLTLFVSAAVTEAPNHSLGPSAKSLQNSMSSLSVVDDLPTSVEIAQRVFRQALLPQGYRRTDKINYEFGGYDLAFATFQKK